MPEVSVVIPCYNYGRFLDEAVESVLAQSCQDFEIVVVDDGSTDVETRALLGSYERPKTTVLRTEHRGLAAARNTGIRASEGRYVVSLDSDDRLHRQYLEKTKAVLDADDSGKLGFVTTWHRLFGDDDVAVRTDNGSALTLAIANHIHAASLFRRQAWESVGGYRESFAGWEDWNFWLNITGAGYRWEMVEEELFYYRKHGDTLSSRSFRNRGALFDDILEDNADFYLENHQEILKLCFEKILRLETVWREKDAALSDNRELARQLRQEQKSHEQALEEYRRLEEYCRSLLSSLEDARRAHEKAEHEYRRLEAHYLASFRARKIRR
jgi:glycosyltransferase involved in cell wall biosynthesis